MRVLKQAAPISWAIGLLVAATALASPSPARAHPQFPGIVDKTLDLTCTPPCTICHLMPTPQPGDEANQRFALNVKAMGGDQGVTEQNLPSILTRLKTDACPNMADPSCASMPCGKCNADGAGDPDIAELEDNQNPNNSSALPCVEYGCFARIASTPPKRAWDATAALAALGVAVALAGRWRRRVAR